MNKIDSNLMVNINLSNKNLSNDDIRPFIKTIKV